MTRDEMLLWLNDLVGKSVHASVRVEKGDLPITVLVAEGALQHWSQRGNTASLRYDSREDIAGWYSVGDGESTAWVDVTDLGHLSIERNDDVEQIQIELCENVFLEILEIR